MLAEHEGGQAMTVGGYTLPAIRDRTGLISVGILPTDLRVAPVREGAGVVAVLATEFGHTDRLERVAAPVDPRAPTGRYVAEAGLTAEIWSREAGARLRLASALGWTDYRLEALGPDLWRGLGDTALPLAVTLEVDETGFLLTSGRTVRLRFEHRQ
jgi:hypothetical protein